MSAPRLSPGTTVELLIENLIQASYEYERADGSAAKYLRGELEKAKGAVRDALRPGFAQQPWQPIETAPQDNGVSVIVWDDPVMGEAYYDPGERSWWWTNTGPGEHTSEAIYPTLWQPMPAPPSNQGASK